MNRFVCIHGHFYQPPRENPWLETIELQDATYPYHDWNERITAECYAANATSRILDEKGRIAQIVNNYTRISFNFGPTLLGWMEKNAPDVYRAILEADRESQRIYSGHGSAIAQVYNHLIMPLANSRDRRTQVIWGLKDFASRFHRKAEGMWLPETAVDLETLDILAEHGVSFTILAPHQTGRVRRIGDPNWKDVSGARINPKRPYLCRLPSGRKITIFFYDGPISQEIAFGGLLKSGEVFAKRLLSTANEQDRSPQLIHIACDGETFGHHHRFGEMALSYALHHIESHGSARLTNYGEYLEMHPPDHEVEIMENTSWSCIHGIERWRSNCGCDSGGRPEWHQSWRTPLREALDWLRDALSPMFERTAASLMADPWEARDRYIEVILDRRADHVEQFIRTQCRQALRGEEKISFLKLLELQRHAMLMYTSCGWFFDDISGIETVQILQYAGRALQLASQVFGNSLEAQFLQRLQSAPSNLAEQGNGRLIFERSVRPAMLSLKNVGAHYAISSLFNGSAGEQSVFCYGVEREAYKYSETGKARMAVGRARFTSTITKGSATLCFTVLYMGDHNVSCGVSEFRGTRLYQMLEAEMIEAFRQADFPLCLRLMDRHFGTSIYSLKSLFREKRRDILNDILGSTLAEAEASYRQLYEYHAPMMSFLKEMGVPAPKALISAAEAALNNSLRRAFENGDFDPEHIKHLFDEIEMQGIPLETESLEFALLRAIERLAEQLLANPSGIEPLTNLRKALALLPVIPLKVNLWTVQNLYFKMLKSHYPHFQDAAKKGDVQAQAWIEQFAALGRDLYIRVEALEQPEGGKQ